MKQALILHGTEASPEANWFRWLESVLIQKEYKVWLPQLPNSATPDVREYNDFILGNADFETNDETIIIGHSSGAVEILSLLQNLPEGVVAGDVYLVSAFKNNLDWSALDGLFREPFNYGLIKTKTRSITLLHSDNDPYVPIDHAEYIAEKLNARLIIIPGQGHFNLDHSKSYKEFPNLIQVIEAQEILRAPHRLTTFRGQKVVFTETQQVKVGVECDIYSFVGDDTKDLGIIRLEKGATTPIQLIQKGEKTIEGFLYGNATLKTFDSSGRMFERRFWDGNYDGNVELGIGYTMKWRAAEYSILYEICYPPYEDGRFKNLN